MSPVQLKFSLDSFRQIDLQNLLINIWDYADKKHLLANTIQNGV